MISLSRAELRAHGIPVGAPFDGQTQTADAAQTVSTCGKQPCGTCGGSEKFRECGGTGKWYVS